MQFVATRKTYSRCGTTITSTAAYWIRVLCCRPCAALHRYVAILPSSGDSAHNIVPPTCLTLPICVFCGNLATARTADLVVPFTTRRHTRTALFCAGPDFLPVGCSPDLACLPQPASRPSLPADSWTVRTSTCLIPRLYHCHPNTTMANYNSPHRMVTDR